MQRPLKGGGCIISKFKKCEYCGVYVFKTKRTRLHKLRNWDSIKWQIPNDPGEPNRFLGMCNDGSTLKSVPVSILLCRPCVEYFELNDLKIDLEKKEYIIPKEITDIVNKKGTKGSSYSSIEQARTDKHIGNT